MVAVAFQLESSVTNERQTVHQLTMLERASELFVLADTVVLDFNTDCAAGPPVTHRESDLKIYRSAMSPFDARVILVVERDGRIRERLVTHASLLPPIQAALDTFLMRVDSGRLLGPIPEEIPAPLKYVVKVNLRPVSSIKGLVRAHFALQHPQATEAPFSDGKGPSPDYPTVAIRAGVEDTLLAAFVIDANGAVRGPTITFRRGNYREFAQAVSVALHRARYQPARYQRCPVPSLAIQLFQFAIK